jgi:Leucine rich repeat
MSDLDTHCSRYTVIDVDDNDDDDDDDAIHIGMKLLLEVDDEANGEVDMVQIDTERDVNHPLSLKRGTQFWMLFIVCIVVIATLVLEFGFYCGTTTRSTSSTGSKNYGGRGKDGGTSVSGNEESTTGNYIDFMTNATVMPPTGINSPVTTITGTTGITTRPINEQLSVACNFLSITNLTECLTTTHTDSSWNAVGLTIPTEIGLLTQLIRLSLCDNDLVGTIPSILGNLIQLTELDLDVGHLIGLIPSTLGKLVRLKYLGLNDNQLSGTIPSTLTNLKQLTHLGLQNNRLSGTVPSTLGRLKQLTHLWLHENQLSGTIPSTLCSNSRIDIYIDCANITCNCCQSFVWEAAACPSC